MKILVIHQVPYRKVGYGAVIDHGLHDVTYLGVRRSLDQIPSGLRHDELVLTLPEGAALDDDHVVAEAVDELLAAAIARGWSADAVVSLSEFGHFAAARARRRLGLPAHDDAALTLVRDKVAMKRAVAAAGLAVPGFLDDGTVVGQAWSGPTILKPRSGAGSAGVRELPTFEAARLACGPGEQIEQVVRGPVLHVDGFVRDGRLDLPTVAECLGSPLDYARGRVIASVQVEEPAAVAFVERCLAALEVRCGAVHVEVFRRAPGDHVFLEAGQRVGGAGVLTAYRRRTGSDLAEREICAQAGLCGTCPEPVDGRFHGFLLGPRPLTPAARAHVRDHLRLEADAVWANDVDSSRTDTYQEWEVPLFAELSAADPAALRALASRHVAAVEAALADDRPVDDSAGVPVLERSLR